MGFLSAILGLEQGSKDDLRIANRIWRRANAEGRDLTDSEVKQVEKLMAMREDKLERIEEQKRGGLGW